MEYAIEITVEELHRLQEQAAPASEPRLRLLDIREGWESETASLPDSMVIPMGEIPDRAHAELKPEERIVVYCHNGRRSLGVARWLREEGFLHAQSLAGGIEVWAREIDPTVPRYEKR